MPLVPIGDLLLQSCMIYIRHMRSFIICSVLSVALLMSSCSLQKFFASEDTPHASTPASAYKNPHSVCVKCHLTDKPKPDGALFAPGADPSASCLVCHDYRENHHPVDYIPADPSASPFPLYEGRVKCLTCHQIHGGAGNEGTDKLLRGGPYQDRREICFRCHSAETYASINPHEMLDNKNTVREVNGKPVCLLCHSKLPDTAADSTDDVRFRADIGFLCWRCHPPMQSDPFFNTHFLVRPSAKTLNNMHQSEEKLFVILPIVPRDRITCSTCHNPHQAGVIQRDAAAKGADTMGRLRLSSMCFACHLI
jgi:predicted CXXCH cytochrome family protein